MKKKLLITTFFVISCLLLFEPNQAQSNDMENLQKQITALKNSNCRLEAKLKQYTKSSTSLHESLQASLNDNNNKLKTLSDSLTAKGLQVNVLKADSEKAKTDIHSIKVANTIQYILLILIIILLIVIYYLLLKKIDKIKEQYEHSLIKTKEGLESDLNKTSKELKTEISSVKEDVQGKINDLTKKLAAINKQGKE